MDGLCPLSLQADGSRDEGDTCSKQICSNIFFCGSLRFCWFKSRAYAGDSLWKVKGGQKFHKTPPPRNSATAPHHVFLWGHKMGCFGWGSVPRSLWPRSRAAAATCGRGRCELPAILRLTPKIASGLQFVLRPAKPRKTRLGLVEWQR